MLINLWDLYALGLALLDRRVTLLTTWGLWTTENLLFPLLLLWKNSSDHGSYMWVMHTLLIYLRFMQDSKETDQKQRLLF
jgi:hypothetical protein